MGLRRRVCLTYYVTLHVFTSIFSYYILIDLSCVDASLTNGLFFTVTRTLPLLNASPRSSNADQVAVKASEGTGLDQEDPESVKSLYNEDESQRIRTLPFLCHQFLSKFSCTGEKRIRRMLSDSKIIPSGSEMPPTAASLIESQQYSSFEEDRETEDHILEKDEEPSEVLEDASKKETATDTRGSTLSAPVEADERKLLRDLELRIPHEEASPPEHLSSIQTLGNGSLQSLNLM